MGILRDYQDAGVAHLHTQWDAGVTRVPMVLATGLGKTVIFTHPKLLDRFLDAGKRVLVIAHTDELIEQAARKARQANPGRTVGIVKAELNQVTAQIIVSSRQTLGHATGGPRRRNAIRNVGLIIIDEAHHAVRGNTYGKILEHFGAFDESSNVQYDTGYDSSGIREHVGEARSETGTGIARAGSLQGNGSARDAQPSLGVEHSSAVHEGGQRSGVRGGVRAGVKVAGFTATLARGDKAKLSTVWQEPAPGTTLFRRDILFGIRNGYLLDVHGERVVVDGLDMRNVAVRGGDYADSSLADELERTFAPATIAKSYLEHAAGRRGIAFWPLVATAEHGAEAFNAVGIASEVIHGGLDKRTRRAMLHRLHTGETQVIHGVGVLTEGFDEPRVDVVVIARPTKSAPLYQQMVGRVLRPDLEKAPEDRGKALVLDVVGAGATHDLRSLIDLSPELKTREDQLDGTLLEMGEQWLELEEEAGQGGDASNLAPEDYDGETRTVAFDPLGRAKLWQQTPDGHWYMSAGTVGYAVLVESLEGEPAHYDVVLCSKLSYPRDGVQPWARGTDRLDLPLDMALGYAEVLADEVGGWGSKSLTSRKSAWRKEQPSDGLKRLARARGVWRDGMTKGECSEAVDAWTAARRIDPLVRDVMGAKA